MRVRNSGFETRSLCHAAQIQYTNVNRLLILTAILASAVVAGDKPAKVYPEHGRIVAIRSGQNSRTLPVYTDPYGKTHGGFTVHSDTHTYRIETDNRFYELTEQSRGASLSLGDYVDFRIEKRDRAYVRNGEKEWRWAVTLVEQKTEAKAAVPAPQAK